MYLYVCLWYVLKEWAVFYLNADMSGWFLAVMLGVIYLLKHVFSFRKKIVCDAGIQVEQSTGQCGSVTETSKVCNLCVYLLVLILLNEVGEI